MGQRLKRVFSTFGETIWSIWCADATDLTAFGKESLDFSECVCVLEEKNCAVGFLAPLMYGKNVFQTFDSCQK